MPTCAIHLHPSLIIDDVDDRIFGGFIEHLGRCIYKGIYDPESHLANDQGIRNDVVDLIRELGVTVIRYPGGNFASGYHWINGVGPREERVRVRDLAWQSTEPNTFGTDEFINFCRLVGAEPMLCANLGTGTPEEAMNWVEYCNSPAGTQWSNLRSEHGQDEPFNVPYWCLGNEMDGPWQLGHTSVEEYTIRARQAAKMMKDCDPNIQTVVCGSSGPMMSTYPDWDRKVMEELGDLADYVSLHRYVGNSDGSEDFLTTSAKIDQQIEQINACALFAQAQRKTKNRIHLCFDEWNVWYRARGPDATNGRGKFAPPLLEERYNLEDALVVAQFLMSFIRHADCVKIANLAQLVNVIAPIFTNADAAFRQSIFHSFKMISSRKGGKSLRVGIENPTESANGRSESAVLDCAAVLHGNHLKIFALNRDLEEPLQLRVSFHGKNIEKLISSELLFHEDLHAENSFDEPDRVSAAAFHDWSIGADATVDLPPHSFVAATFETN